MYGNYGKIDNCNRYSVIGPLTVAKECEPYFELSILQISFCCKLYTGTPSPTGILLERPPIEAKLKCGGNIHPQFSEASLYHYHYNNHIDTY